MTTTKQITVETLQEMTPYDLDTLWNWYCVASGKGGNNIFALTQENLNRFLGGLSPFEMLDIDTTHFSKKDAWFAYNASRSELRSSSKMSDLVDCRALANFLAERNFSLPN